MGEYINHNGEEIKLGTCEDLYYARFDQLKGHESEFKGMSGKETIGEYLDIKNGFRYRFPFPDEDGIEVGNFEQYDRGFLVHIKNEANYITLDNHYEIWHSKSINGGYNVNIKIPCPYSKEIEAFKTSPITRGLIEIVQQKQVDGELWTVIRCPYCHSMARIDRKDAEILVIYLNNNDTEKEIGKRIIAGYKTAVKV